MFYSLISWLGQKLIATAEWLFKRFCEAELKPPGWTNELCQHTKEMLSEFLKLYDGDLREFRQISPEQARITRGNSWKVFILKAYGRSLIENMNACPITSQLCSRIPQVTSIMFSVLEPGTHLTPHRGPYAGVLRCHIPLIVPEGNCAIRVGNKVHQWKVGYPVLFDDTIEHEAWNRASGSRVVLFIDFIRPLPQPLAALNRFMIWLIGISPYIGRMLRASR
jgi:ornithine lipid ester-linked acyl 2-hydroxylase